MKSLLIALLSVTFLSSCGFEVVDTGYRGVETRFGKVVGEALPEGLYFYNPFTSNITELDVRTLKFADSTLTYSADAQVVKISSTINFNLKSDAVHTVYKTIGTNWEEKLIIQVLHGTVKEITGKYKAVDLIANREKATTEIESLLKSRFLERSIVLSSFQMNNLDFDDTFEEAVKKKVIAVERAKEMKNVTVTVAEEARQGVIKEEAFAKIKVIKAKAAAKSIMVRAGAEAKANTTVSKTLTSSLIEYERVKKWSGTLPSVMTGGGSGTLLNLDISGKR